MSFIELLFCDLAKEERPGMSVSTSPVLASGTHPGPGRLSQDPKPPSSQPRKLGAGKRITSNLLILGTREGCDVPKVTAIRTGMG